MYACHLVVSQPCPGVDQVEFTDVQGKRWTLILFSDFIAHHAALPQCNPQHLFLVWDKKGLTPPSLDQSLAPDARDAEFQKHYVSLWGVFGVDPDGTALPFVTGRIDRGFYQGQAEESGYSRLVILEEPAVPMPADGSQRKIGAVVVQQRADGKVRIERRGSLSDAPDRIRLTRASTSNPDQPPPGVHRGWCQSNDERIKGGMTGGKIEVRYVQCEFPDDVAMTIAELKAASLDAISARALNVVFG